MEIAPDKFKTGHPSNSIDAAALASHGPSRFGSQ